MDPVDAIQVYSGLNARTWPAIFDTDPGEAGELPMYYVVPTHLIPSATSCPSLSVLVLRPCRFWLTEHYISTLICPGAH
ncbi:hypothetical protein ACN42_g11158 [Penicillium freii]|uniref:Uncharacterized protein n=1 Tax=Penicillium freii TaxID=48697 RepID=A0A101M8N9_PENFR|nr:hypothetical protein ACN42_g11158 [Penicillium freii]